MRSFAIGLTLLMATACTDSSQTPPNTEHQKPDNTLMKVITPTVWYRERKALPPGAQVIVVLEDQSRMDAPATVITDYPHKVDGPGPYHYRLVYDPRAIDDRMRYGLRARIEHEGRLLITSTEHVDPFAIPPGENIEIMVSIAGKSPRS